MKRICIIMICIALGLCAACTKPAPAEQPASPTEAPEEPTEAPAESTEAPAKPTEAPEEPTDAPEEPVAQADLAFETETLSGEAITSDIIGDYDLIIVNFWAEWCGPCVAELPALERIHTEYPNVLILGVWLGDSLNEALDTLESAGVTYPAILYEGTLTDYAGRSMYIPASYFFDKNGAEIGEPVIGSMEYAGWKTVVEGLLK